MSKEFNHDVFQKMYPLNEVGKMATLISPELVIQASQLVKTGRIYDLGTERYRGIPTPAVHPPFEVIAYRTPQGSRNEADQPWLNEENNLVNFRPMNEVIFGSMHTGTHIDALAHVTCGDDNHWYRNHNAQQHLGDRGPLKADGSKFLPLFTRGVLLDVASYLKVDLLEKGFPIDAALLERTAQAQGVQIREGDTVLIRTGYMQKWPSRDSLEYEGAGITLEAAKWLANKGAVSVGADTERLEVYPGQDPTHPRPVHTYLLIEEGIHIMEMVELETLSRDKAYEFLFVGLPLTIRGTTGSMINPIAVV
jgi:kynurenine formamidase